MGEAFRIGGWGMYPTTIIGVLLLTTAVRYMRQPSTRRLQIVGNLRLLTLLSGALGFVTGVIKTFTHVPADRPGDVVTWAVIGVGESLSNVALALVLLVLATIVTTVGAWRSERPAAELVDPHAG